MILVYCLLSMVCFTLIRAGLYVRSWNVIDHSLLHTLGIFGVGLAYDVIFNLYLSLFFAVLLFMIPNRIFHQAFFSQQVRASLSHRKIIYLCPLFVLNRRPLCPSQGDPIIYVLPQRTRKRLL